MFKVSPWLFIVNHLFLCLSLAKASGLNDKSIVVDSKAKCWSQNLNILSFTQSESPVFFEASGNFEGIKFVERVHIFFMGDLFSRVIEPSKSSSETQPAWKLIENTHEDDNFSQTGIFSLHELQSNGKYFVKDPGVHCSGLGKRNLD